MVEAGRNGWQGGMKEKREGGREGARDGAREGGRPKKSGKFPDLPIKQVAQDLVPFFLCLFRRLIVGFLPELGVFEGGKSQLLVSRCERTFNHFNEII